MRDPLPNIREDNESIPQSIENIILKATAKNPKNRYEDIRSMHDDLLTALDDERMNEEPLIYKYPEHETENTKRLKKLEELEQEEIEDTQEVAEKIDPEDKSDKKNKKVIIILFTIFALLIVALLAVVFVVPKVTKPKVISIPDVEGLTVSKATEKLEDLGFVVKSKIELVPSDTIEKGRVVRTDPAIGKKIKKGTKVAIYKSSGKETFALEDYTGKNYIEVQTILETKYKLIVTVEKKDVETSDYDEQEIIGQSLAAKSEVKEGDSITLYIPNLVETFPDMVALGYSYDDVTAFAKKYELELKTEYVETTQYEANKVISQSRIAGTEIVKGTTLTVEIAIKPKETPKKEETTTEKKEEEKQENGENKEEDKASSQNTPTTGE